MFVIEYTPVDVEEAVSETFVGSREKLRHRLVGLRREGAKIHFVVDMKSDTLILCRFVKHL